MLSCDVGIFGEELRRLRTAAGMSQQQLADAIAVALAYISQIERGKRPASEAVAVRLAEALGVDPIDLLALRLVETGQLPGADELSVDQARELIRRLRSAE